MTRYEEIAKKANELCNDPNNDFKSTEDLCKIMAEWADEHPKSLWYDAQGDDLPEIDREVIVLTQSYPLEGNEYAVYFGHRPYKKGYLGKNLLTGNVETFYPQTYGKGEWNIPDVKWWLDVKLPNEEKIL